ncbi:MAG: hypothetical protein AB8F95_03155 [Bacteroidia bacterium]
MPYIIGFAIGLLWLLAACEEPKAPDNPFDNLPRDTTVVNPIPDLDPISITALHQDIFSPTCANSGCHDGTFEPDFRTVESSYNTLLFHPIIKNNPAGNYTYRVVPGDADASVLWNRLNEDIDGQSGIMPLALEPDSDWEEKKDQYRQRIRSWINGGAKDIFGNAASGTDLQPTALGLEAFVPGNTNAIPRESNKGAIVVPGSTPSIDIWVSLDDDNVNAIDLGQPELLVSESLNDFSNARVLSLSVVSPRSGNSYLGRQVDYVHKAIFDLSGIPPNTQFYVRVKVTDPGQPERTELPGNGANSYIKRYFSVIIK